jgi:hypothetical protein
MFFPDKMKLSSQYECRSGCGAVGCSGLPDSMMSWRTHSGRSVLTGRDTSRTSSIHSDATRGVGFVESLILFFVKASERNINPQVEKARYLDAKQEARIPSLVKDEVSESSSRDITGFSVYFPIHYSL